MEPQRSRKNRLLIDPASPVKRLDPYLGCAHRCVYCFALDEADRPAGVLVHPDLAGQLARDLAALEPQAIYVGSLSDAYQPAEATHRQTRQALELLAERGFSAIILTKSGLAARDADLLAAMPEAALGVSLSFQDEDVRRLFEPGAPANTERIAALRTLQEAGVRTYALITPVMPFLTDAPALVEAVAPYADDIWVQRLGFAAEQDQSWQGLRATLDRHFPALTAAYREIAFSETHPYWAEVRQTLLATRWDRLRALGCEARLHIRL